MRKHQEEIYSAIKNNRDWAGSNVVISTKNRITSVYFYGHKIAVINHIEKTATFDNCGYNKACTTARLNAIKMACDELGYKY
jgi:hypothetical protein